MIEVTILVDYAKLELEYDDMEDVTLLVSDLITHSANSIKFEIVKENKDE